MLASNASMRHFLRNPNHGCQEYAGRIFAYSRILLAFDVPHMQLHISEKSKF